MLAVLAFTTEPSTPYTFTYILGPLRMPFGLDFEIKIGEDALIALADSSKDSSIFAEIGS